MDIGAIIALYVLLGFATFMLTISLWAEHSIDNVVDALVLSVFWPLSLLLYVIVPFLARAWHIFVKRELK